MDFEKKIFEANKIPFDIIEGWKNKGERIVFTNGCFDILHRGHIHYLYEAGQLGDKLIVGLNSDSSVSRLKGEGRPVKDEKNRAEILASLVMVDMVIIFDKDTPLELIRALTPDILVKGGDWPVDKILGADHVLVRRLL